MNFDPFESRLCRDVRNKTGAAVIRSLKKGSTTPFEDTVKGIEPDKLPPACRNYIAQRKTALILLLEKTKCGKADGSMFYIIAEHLWNARLYFEMHEWIEEKWAAAAGDEKRWLQALILAATALEQFEYNRTGPAGKLAAKAVRGIEQHAGKFAGTVNAGQILQNIERIAAL